MTPNINNAETCRQSVKSPPFKALDVDELLNRCMGNLKLVHRVLDKFQQRLPEELADITEAMENEDTERIARIAHRVKGTAASVSAPGLVRAAAEIEDMSRSGIAKDLPLSIECLRGEWERCLDEAAAFLSASDIG